MDPKTDPLLKTVLLFDSHQDLGEARASRLRRYGIAVETTATVEAARARLKASKYDLILVAPRGNPEEAIRLHREIKQLRPQQRVAFFVGPPKYISFTYNESPLPMPARLDTWTDRLKGRMASG